MKILVTGIAGFIGSHLAEKLIELGHEVVGIDAFNDYYPVVLKEQNAKEVEAKGGKILRLNLAEDDLHTALAGVEVVYHLAAQPGISEKVSFDEYLTNNFVATHRLLETVENLPTLKFFINIATSSVYGLNACFSEEKAPEPASFYGVTKLAAEQLVLSYTRDRGFPACSFRLYSVYGPRERPDKLYPKAIRSILTDYKFPYFEGSEKHERSFTYVKDIVAGLVAVLDNFDKCIGEVINLGSDTTTTTEASLDVLQKVLGAPIKFERLPRRAGDQFKTSALIDKARRLLNYNPSTTLEQGFTETGIWFKEKVLPLIEKGDL